MADPIILPTPRIELRWRYATDEEIEGSVLGGDGKYACDYGLVMPVSRNDIRSNAYDEDSDVEIIGAKSELFHKFGTTLRGGAAPGDQETPFRDGVHAMRDAKVLGLDVWVVGLYGDRNPVEPKR
jgi:hypothetical protein